jgi:anti-sigma factor RsiW
MGGHEEFLELCASATAGELSADEQAKLEAHLALCPECRRAMSEYEAAAGSGVSALAEELAPEGAEDTDSSWSLERAEKAFFKRLDSEQERESDKADNDGADPVKVGQRYTYRPSQIRWRELWMPFAAAVLLALALGIAAYRTGMKRGTDVAHTTPVPAKASESLEEQASDAGYERAQWIAKRAEDGKVIDDLKRQLAEQRKVVNSLRITEGAQTRATPTEGPSGQGARESGARGDEELATAQAKLQELQKTMDAVTAQREEATARAAILETKVGDLTRLVRDREQALDQKDGEVARQQELLEHDRDIRELMGARDLYIAEVHDVARTGQTDKTYGRVFYTKGKSLIFYAYDLDAQPGVRNLSSFQAWGRKGPDKQQALNLGIFYEDNVSKKRWVLKADDPKTLQDIDAVFVTVEPNGGSHHPSGKQLLFAYLRVTPNHP